MPDDILMSKDVEEEIDMISQSTRQDYFNKLLLFVKINYVLDIFMYVRKWCT